MKYTDQESITSSLSHLPEICKSLATLDTAVGFLASVGGDGNAKLCDFISDQLRMSEMLPVNAGRCKLKHVKSLWLALERHRACLLKKQGQIPLEAVDDIYRQPLDEDQVI